MCTYVVNIVARTRAIVLRIYCIYRFQSPRCPVHCAICGNWREVFRRRYVDQCSIPYVCLICRVSLDARRTLTSSAPSREAMGRACESHQYTNEYAYSWQVVWRTFLEVAGRKRSRKDEHRSPHQPDVGLAQTYGTYWPPWAHPCPAGVLGSRPSPSIVRRPILSHRMVYICRQ